MSEHEEKAGAGLSVGGLHVAGDNVEVNVVQGNQQKGDTAQTVNKMAALPEMTDALASLRALLEGVEDEVAADLDALDGALGEAVGAKDVSWARKGFDALGKLWRVVETLPEKAAACKELVDKLGGFLGDHCGLPWTGTFG